MSTPYVTPWVSDAVLTNHSFPFHYFLQEKDNKTDCKDDIKALTLQIQNLVTRVSEMQNDLKKKDDKIKTLKKMVKKNSGDGKGKIYESVQVLV